MGVLNVYFSQNQSYVTDIHPPNSYMRTPDMYVCQKICKDQSFVFETCDDVMENTLLLPQTGPDVALAQEKSN